HSLTVVETAERIRVVVNLVQSAPFKIRAKGNIVYLTISGSLAAVSLGAEIAANAKRHSIKRIDFRRGESGQGRVIVSLSDTQTPVDIREEGKHIIVDFINTT